MNACTRCGKLSNFYQQHVMLNSIYLLISNMVHDGMQPDQGTRSTWPKYVSERDRECFVRACQHTALCNLFISHMRNCPPLEHNAIICSAIITIPGWKWVCVWLLYNNMSSMQAAWFMLCRSSIYTMTVGKNNTIAIICDTIAVTSHRLPHVPFPFRVVLLKIALLYTSIFCFDIELILITLLLLLLYSYFRWKLHFSIQTHTIKSSLSVPGFNWWRSACFMYTYIFFNWIRADAKECTSWWCSSAQQLTKIVHKRIYIICNIIYITSIPNK